LDREIQFARSSAKTPFGLRWEAKRHTALDDSATLAPYHREESKAVSPLRSATALHTLAALWTAVGSDSATPLWINEFANGLGQKLFTLICHWRHPFNQ
jgi:hypothetical protein